MLIRVSNPLTLSLLCALLLFAPEIVQQFCESMGFLAEGFVQNPDDRLRALPGEPGKFFVTPWRAH